MSSASANKPIQREKRCCRREDRLSNLPIEIRVSILSRLGLVEAVRATLLSSRWKELWRQTDVTKLIFCERPIWVPLRSRRSQQRYSADISTQKFVGYVNRVLKLLHHAALDEFAINYSYPRCELSFNPLFKAVDAWLQFAYTKGVRRLELNLRSEKIDFSLDFGYGLYTFRPTGGLSSFAGLHNLKDLRLQSVDVEPSFECLLSSCPLLERLTIKYVEWVHLKLVGSSRLKFLEIYCPRFCQWFFNVKITSTNLLQLKYYAPNSTLCVNTNHLLSDLKLYGTHVGEFLRSPFHDNFDFIFHLNKLTLGVPHKVYKDPILTLRFPEFNKLVQLELIMQIFEGRPSWPFALIEAAPLLHRFAVKFTDRRMYHNEPEIWKLLRKQRSRDFWKAATKAKEFSHDNLKSVEVSGFNGTLAQVEFVGRLLGIGTSLEEVVINIIKYEEADPIRLGPERDSYSNSERFLNMKKVQMFANNAVYYLEKRIPFGAKLVVVCD